jgi:hypothetical protein
MVQENGRKVGSRIGRPLIKDVLHKQWKSPNAVLETTGYWKRLGDTYPHRVVVDLKAKRQKSVYCEVAMRRQ